MGSIANIYIKRISDKKLEQKVEHNELKKLKKARKLKGIKQNKLAK
jgi:hypothetical protein